MERKKGRPGGGVRPPTGSNQRSDGISTEPYSGNSTRSLAVDTPHTDAEAALEAKVRAQLPGSPVGKILVLLNQAHHSVTKDAAALARLWGVPLAIVTAEGEVLAYRTPDDQN